jgi:hypothetical protein
LINDPIEGQTALEDGMDLRDLYDLNERMYGLDIIIDRDIR